MRLVLVILARVTQRAPCSCLSISSHHHSHYSLVAVIPDAVCQPLYIKPIQVLVTVKSVQIVIQLVVVAVVLLLLLLLLLLVVVVHVVHGVHLHRWVLGVELFHDLQIHLVMHLESLGFDLLFPVVVVNLHVVQDGVDENANVGVLVGQQFQYDRNHLGLV